MNSWQLPRVGLARPMLASRGNRPPRKTRSLMKTRVAGSLSARIVPAVLIGAANTAGMLLTTQILFIVFLGFTPLVVTTAAVVEEKKRGVLRTRGRPAASSTSG